MSDNTTVAHAIEMITACDSWVKTPLLPMPLRRSLHVIHEWKCLGCPCHWDDYCLWLMSDDTTIAHAIEMITACNSWLTNTIVAHAIEIITACDSWVKTPLLLMPFRWSLPTTRGWQCLCCGCVQDEKRFYQLELVNRETNFNKVFNTTPNVGVLNPLSVKVRAVPHCDCDCLTICHCGSNWSLIEDIAE